MLKKILKSELCSKALLQELSALRYRKAPSFLGNFSFQAFGKGYKNKTSGHIRKEAIRLSRLVPTQTFTNVFVQKYEAGQNVKPHRDPKNNTGHTIISIYGSFHPTPLNKVWYSKGKKSENFFVHEGEALVLPCTISGQQGPWHSMSWEPWATGTRYAIILNTIEKS